MKTVHVKHAGWNVLQDGVKKPIATHSGKTEATTAGRSVAKALADEIGEPVTLEIETFDGELDATKIYRPSGRRKAE
ncbi:hypothetical protein LCGC14_1570530 [marine sediment metagenome]|uniref:DUF2188 domain-containing protein n=1 Tax=marine sediment metagenome TaxID=412755 RepID=A0A0F9L0W4_9ZZZZ